MSTVLVVDGQVGGEEVGAGTCFEAANVSSLHRDDGRADKRALIADQRDVGDQTLIPLLPTSYPFVMLPIPLLLLPLFMVPLLLLPLLVVPLLLLPLLMVPLLLLPLLMVPPLQKSFLPFHWSPRHPPLLGAHCHLYQSRPKCQSTSPLLFLLWHNVFPKKTRECLFPLFVPSIVPYSPDRETRVEPKWAEDRQRSPWKSPSCQTQQRGAHTSPQSNQEFWVIQPPQSG